MEIGKYKCRKFTERSFSDGRVVPYFLFNLNRFQYGYFEQQRQKNKSKIIHLSDVSISDDDHTLYATEEGISS